MAPRMSKRTHQGTQMAIPRRQKGSAAEGVAFKINELSQRDPNWNSSDIFRLGALAEQLGFSNISLATLA